MDGNYQDAMEAIESCVPTKKPSAKDFVEQAAPRMREKIKEGVSLRQLYEITKSKGGFEKLSFGTFKTYLYGTGK